MGSLKAKVRKSKKLPAEPQAKIKVSSSPIAKPASVTSLEATVLFEKVAQDVLHGNRSVFDTLSDHEQRTVMQWFVDAMADEEGHSPVHDVLWEIDFHRKPVPIEQFLDDDYYLGKACSELHPLWKRDMCTVFAHGSPIYEWIATGCIGSGKGQPVTGRVLTPSGWVCIGDVKVGDRVIGSNGSSVRVRGVYPRGRLQIYRVHFDDSSWLDVDGDHLWSVLTPSSKHQELVWKTKDTRTLFRHGVRYAKGQKKYHIPVVSAPVQYARTSVPFPSYSLGVLLGDGGLTSGGIRLSSADSEIIDDVCCETGLSAHYVGCGVDYRLVWEGERGNSALTVLRALGVCVHSYDKRIPPMYLRASVDDRKRLLAGLLDTDGWVHALGTSTEFSTSSEGLARDVVELVRSLGGVTRLRRKKTACRDCFTVGINLPFNPFFVRRKAQRWKAHGKYCPRRMMDRIEKRGKEDVVCIEVDAADGLYVADQFIVTHNTTIAMASMAYKLHYISCLRDPAKYYGLLPESLLVFGIYSITKRQVADAGYFKLRGFIDSSPYFAHEFPRSKKIDSQIVFLHKNVRVVPGSQELHALGLDLFSFAMDEVNFMRAKENKEAGRMTGQAYDLYNATYTRLQSRFLRPGGTLPGIMLLLSSRNSQTSFLEEHLKVAAKRDSTYISDYALWDVKPKSRFRLPKFKVEVGDRLAASRILGDEEIPRAGARIVEVPGEFKPNFSEDVDQALRDIAGVATFNVSPLIHDRQSVYDAIRTDWKHPFTRNEVVLSVEDDTLLSAFYDIEAACAIRNSNWVPRLNPMCPRFIHVDLALSNDAAGIAMGHVSGVKALKRQNQDGTVENKEDPFILIDLMLRIVAPPSGEIDISKIRAFVLYLCSMYQVLRVTFDTYQSADSIQLLKKQGVESGNLSVDRDDEAYRMLRSALFDRRMAYYEYARFLDEVLDLERDVRARKVDHPARSSKGGKGCFSGDTRVRLLSGTVQSLASMAACQSEDPFYVYTIRDGRVDVGVARNPRLTRRKARTVVVVLDTGAEICCTPDHLFMLRDGSYKVAEDLEGCSLMPLYTRVARNKDGMCGYELYRCPADGRWHFTHRMVGRWKYGDRYTGNQYGDGLLHHTQGKANNDPRNLLLVDAEEHGRRYAEDLRRRRSDPVFEAPRLERALAYARSPEGRECSRANMARLNGDSEFAAARDARTRALGLRTGTINITRYNRSEKHRRVAARIGRDTIHYAIAASRGPRPQSRGCLNHNARKDVTFDRIVSAFSVCGTQKGVLSELGCAQKVVYRVLRERGFTWASFSASLRYHNHRVVSVRRGPLCDVYDLTVEGTENFALESGVFVHNSKDVSDAVAGVVYHCITDSRAGTGPLMADPSDTVSLSKTPQEGEVAPIPSIPKPTYETVPAPTTVKRIAGSRVDWEQLRGNINA